MTEEKKVFDTFEDELDAIRVSLYEETKNMTPKEQIACLEARVAPVYKQFNIKRSDLKPVIPRKRERVTG